MARPCSRSWKSSTGGLSCRLLLSFGLRDRNICPPCPGCQPRGQPGTPPMVICAGPAWRGSSPAPPCPGVSSSSHRGLKAPPASRCPGDAHTALSGQRTAEKVVLWENAHSQYLDTSRITPRAGPVSGSVSNPRRPLALWSLTEHDHLTWVAVSVQECPGPPALERRLARTVRPDRMAHSLWRPVQAANQPHRWFSGM